MLFSQNVIDFVYLTLPNSPRLLDDQWYLCLSCNHLFQQGEACCASDRRKIATLTDIIQCLILQNPEYDDRSLEGQDHSKELIKQVTLGLYFLSFSN